jgi:polysaccharide export outer membrane protein
MAPIQAAQRPTAQPQKKGPVASELSELNMNRVAATVPQIRTVLRKAPTLFLELKGWIAKEASDRGQIVEDADLTDRAVLERLEESVEFRAAATRLLQSYGYLLPQVNPESELGRERALVLQEKAKLIARAEWEEENRLFQREPQVETARSFSGRQEATEAAAAAGTARGQRSRLETPPGDSDSGLPPDISARSREVPLLSASLSQPPASKAESPGNPDRYPGNPPLRSEEYGRFVDLMVGNWQRDFDETANRSRRERQSANLTALPSGSARAAKDSPQLTFRPHPYSDIPSLYDLYQQAFPRPARLERFGEGVFLRAADFEDKLPMDLPVGPEYVVGPGDSLLIDLYGGFSQRFQRVVDRDGRIALPEAGPVLVSGKTMGEVQRTVQQVLRTQFRDVSADVSLARLRTIRVYVVGDVRNPGPYEVSSLSTPLNALFQALGPNERGSLRFLRHMRGTQLVQVVDVYDLLLRGVRRDLKRLENGDSVLVPPLGPSVKVEGLVRRPAIYELGDEKTLADVLQLAGGILPTATLRNIQVQRLEANERRTMLSVNVDPTASREEAEKAIRSFAIGDNDEIKIFPIAQQNQEIVYLDGHALRPGKYSFRPGMRATDVLRSFADLLPEPATKYAEIVRLNPPDYRPSVEGFDLGAALADPSKAPLLQPMDTIRVFSRYDFEDPPMVWVGGEVHKPGAYLTSGVVHLRDAVHLAGGATPDAAMSDAQVFRTMPDSTLRILSLDLGKALAGDPAHNIPLTTRDRLLVHRNLAKVDPPSVYIKGEVSKPGRYPLTTNMGVADLLRVAGGLKRSADLQSADLTRFVLENGAPHAVQQQIDLGPALAGDPQSNLLLRDGDTVAIRQRAGWGDIAAYVTVRGEVNAPGTFGIRPGERLSSILERAGGFRQTAFPGGGILERVSVMEMQERQRAELIFRIQDQIDNLRVSLKEAPQNQLPLQQQTIEQLTRSLVRLQESPVRGNLVIRLPADLKKLAGSSDDIEVRAGDVLTIPKQPTHVSVTGQVYNPNAIAYRQGKSVEWYLQRAGGPTELANRKDIFVVRANGSVFSAKGTWWGLNQERILPGDVIVVPEKPVISPFWTRNGAIIAQILSSAAVSVALGLR